ncbi:carboxypeptidase S [Metschnikowia bicuspidata var. bicuspidata NRRL YB-4993]|uniref:Carboxypeptidase S n=1 Tax=Metschnikowia bicuspidata var. bicuspidata NRRL YB-4993 TaxID=869754 RepID=A0A1A0HF69_9ASCO|nr:carboxypeptidase S [Metschnikowia bicuspidata var. bicuspidata NRRL YB-4993]OBA22630.1 carboxypeptidase S [Metschnikowia bicuspidata var. bicuspidata NRRL YB-4993]
MKVYVFSATVALLAVFFFTNFVSYVKILLQLTSDASLCPVFDSRAPPRFATDNSTVLRILNSDAYRMESVKKLSSAVRVDTQVTDNLPDVAEAPEKWEHFAQFHEYLEQHFPRIYEACDVFKVNTWGLVFHWKGADSSLKPLLLAAHQDVVPVQKDTLNDWTYPPFDGHYDGKYVYGRGASDCKNSLVAVMEALDLLISENYAPQRGVLVAFGFDEEISGTRGASTIAAFLEDKFGKDSVYAIIDEGPGLLQDAVTGNLVAAPATGEKGYADIRVDLFMKGGHSSIPPDHGAIGIMGELAYNIEQDQYSPLLTDENPLLQYMQCLAVNSGDKMSKLQKKAILRAGFDKVANSKVVKVLSQNSLTKYLIKTSQAADVIHGGEKANALPEDVALVVNHRVAIGTTVAEVQDHFVSRVVSLAKKYGMDVEAFGKPVFKTKEPAGSFSVSTFGTDLEYAPVTPSKGKVWEYLASTTRHVFEDLVLNNTLGYPLVTAPCLMPANTDTRYYWNLTKNIFRYSPMIVDMFENNIHSVDEKILFDGHLQLTAWYYEYIQNVDSKHAE